MAYDDFLTEFAIAHGVGDREELLSKHSERYAFQIKSRERAKKMIEVTQAQFGFDYSKGRALDIGCAYGSFSIEMARLGVKVVGVDLSDKWLRLAEANARDDVDVTFIKADASSYPAYHQLAEHGPFDYFIVNDVFEHIFDTVGVMENISRLNAPNASIYFKIPNGLATRNVLREGHKKIYGLSLLAPDYWQAFVKAPFQIYYRRWQFFESIFKTFGYTNYKSLNKVHDPDHDTTRRFVVNDLNKIRRHLRPENFEDNTQYAYLRQAVRNYYEEVKADLDTLPWEDLYYKYRVTFWEGKVSRES